jgi:hypothetical protein
MAAVFLALDHKDPKDAIDSVLHPAFDSMIRDCTQIQNERVFLPIFDFVWDAKRPLAKMPSARWSFVVRQTGLSSHHQLNKWSGTTERGFHPSNLFPRVSLREREVNPKSMDIPAAQSKRLTFP